jgi:nucleotide-binding universal stress UspA family protein
LSYVLKEEFMFKHLLVPLDGSGLAETALPAAVSLAQQFHSKLLLLRVVRPPDVTGQTSGGISYGEFVADLRQRGITEAEHYLRSQQGVLRQQGIDVEVLVVEGRNVAELILDNCADLRIDTIVMSTHGRGGLSRWVFGSVADKVLRRAHVPVLLIRTLGD